MWNIERTEDGVLPLYVLSAILDAQQWLQHQQYWGGLLNADNRGVSWTLGSRITGRHFAVAQYPAHAFGGTSQEGVLILARPGARWNESREMSDIPSPEVAKHPLTWFASIPWTAHLSRNRDHLVLFCAEQNHGGVRFPAWTLTLPISLSVWNLLYADSLRQREDLPMVSRFALGDGVFVPVLGFDVMWGSIVSTPVRIDPLIEELRQIAKNERRSVLLDPVTGMDPAQQRAAV